MKRISVDEVLAAYKATGLKPARGFGKPNTLGMCCAIGALYCSGRKKVTSVYEWADRRFGRQYASDFIDGFDTLDGNRKYRSRGFRDGRAAAAAVFGDQGDTQGA